ncbi:palmitoyltransferase ZDHHC1 isoform 2-T3 [Discoglossus pictus]
MTICTKQTNKTEPEKDVEETNPEPPQHSRKNGWSWPPHPLQIIAWATYLLFTIIGFGVLVPLLPRHWLPAGYICMGAMFILHCIVHFLAVTINPADENVRTKSSPGPLPAFDRSKHAHVIENMHCYICEVVVGPKSKHCSICNKCVSHFDHHCKWLNNCVGGKNYWLFLSCLISAFLGTLVLSTVSSYVFVAYFIDPDMLRTNKHYEVLKNFSDVWLVFLPAAPVETQAPVILALAAMVSVMGLITLLLIGQLLCFHFYLLWNKLSTYEYIMHQRQKQEMKSNGRPPEDGGKSQGSRVPVQEESYGGSLIYTNPDVRIEGSSSGSLNMDCAALPISDMKPEEDLESDPRPSPTVQNKPRKKKKKKRKKANKISPEAAKHFEERPAHRALLPPPRADPPMSPAPPSLAPSPVFPPRSLPVLVPINVPQIQAAAPPAEYHSDSAESMEEIPVAQTHLGSSAMSENLVFSQRSPKKSLSAHENGLGQSHIRTVTLHQRFELLPKMPSVFVSESSGQPLPTRLLAEAMTPDNHCTHYNKMWVAQGREGEQVLSVSNAEFLASGNSR